MSVLLPDNYDITKNQTYRGIELLKLQFELLGRGKYRSMLVQGPPGMGKTFLANKHLKIAGAKIGLVRSNAVNMFDALYKHRHPGRVIMFDDYDAIFNSESSMNQMKVAGDPGAKIRMIVDTYKKRPDFPYGGRLLWVTNKHLLNNPDFDGFDKKMIVHIDALLSRLQLKVVINDDPLESFHYTNWLATDGEHLLRDYRHESTNNRLSIEASNEILQCFAENFPRLREVSPRALMEMAHHRLVAPSMWRDLVESGLLLNPRIDPKSKREVQPQKPWIIQPTGRPKVRQLPREESSHA